MICIVKVDPHFNRLRERCAQNPQSQNPPLTSSMSTTGTVHPPNLLARQIAPHIVEIERRTRSRHNLLGNSVQLGEAPRIRVKRDGKRLAPRTRRARGLARFHGEARTLKNLVLSRISVAEALDKAVERNAPARASRRVGTGAGAGRRVAGEARGGGGVDAVVHEAGAVRLARRDGRRLAGPGAGDGAGTVIGIAGHRRGDVSLAEAAISAGVWGVSVWGLGEDQGEDGGEDDGEELHGCNCRSEGSRRVMVRVMLKIGRAHV